MPFRTGIYAQLQQVECPQSTAIPGVYTYICLEARRLADLIVWSAAVIFVYRSIIDTSGQRSLIDFTRGSGYAQGIDMYQPRDRMIPCKALAQAACSRGNRTRR